jgi:hypothetical protein
VLGRSAAVGCGRSVGESGACGVGDIVKGEGWICKRR